MTLWSRLLKEEDGQAVMEYVVIAAMISIVAITMIQMIGMKNRGVWSQVNSQV